MYIHEDDIQARAEEHGYNPNARFHDEQPQWEFAEQELINEHIDRIFEVMDEALEALSDEPKKKEVVEMLLKGWTSDEPIEDDLVCLDGHYFFGEWEIKDCDGQWLFTHNHRDGGDFFEIDLLAGLHICEEVDAEFSSQLSEFLRVADLKPITELKLGRLIEAAKNTGIIEGLTKAHEPMLRDWDNAQQMRGVR